MSGRIPVAVKRRVIGVVIVLAVAALAAEIWVTGHVTFAGAVFPVISIVSGLRYLWSARRLS